MPQSEDRVILLETTLYSLRPIPAASSFSLRFERDFGRLPEPCRNSRGSEATSVDQYSLFMGLITTAQFFLPLQNLS